MGSAAGGTPPILSLVADPQRWQLLTELARSDRRVGELTALLGKPQNLVSYHLGELRAAGLVTSRRSSADGRDVYYRAELHRCRDLLAEAGGALHPALRLLPSAPPPSPRDHGPRRLRVLFLCTGNSARSQMAEALLVAATARRVDVRSAGSHPKPLHRNAVRVMAERGLDIAGNEPKHLRRFARTRFDRVITVCDKVREVSPEFPGAPVAAHWSIGDPATTGDSEAATYPAFRRVAEELATRIELLLPDLTPPVLTVTRPAERTSHAR